MVIKKLITYVLLSVSVFANTDLSFTECSNGEQNSLEIAYDAALNMAKDTKDAIQHINGSLVGDRYTHWFGAENEERVTKVKSVVNRIHDVLVNKEVSFNCGICKEDSNYYRIYSYVVPDEEYIVNPCGVFWILDVNGTDSQGGTIIHGVSHFISVGETKDYAYGQSNAEILAENSPDLAVINADSYEYFFENNPKLEMIVDFDGDGINDSEDLDDDNDGISDADEIKNGLDPKNPSDADIDLDGDGFSNKLEIIAGTDIEDENSVPIWAPILMENIITFIPVKP
ncbi:MAG: Peptidyl-Lys metalloendopeptidase [uncultured Sulfurovum sp.]|uniref:Peptidyl-Lys metalloendopeptidase n=1 Tax=uncultured Sulfurovum sp. TaxID=269237 RepID=A0A6S6SZP4_9BACT|nr:MAG: Peptidyl-Lys metalloendopeptidase [uncultured Sulfurovum sp.]